MTRRLVVEADGGSRGNSGIAAGGAVLLDEASGAVLSEIGVAANESMDRRESFRRDLDGGQA